MALEKKVATATVYFLQKYHPLLGTSGHCTNGRFPAIMVIDFLNHTGGIP
jgi:hypothetical protein